MALSACALLLLRVAATGSIWDRRADGVRVNYRWGECRDKGREDYARGREKGRTEAGNKARTATEKDSKNRSRLELLRKWYIIGGTATQSSWVVEEDKRRSVNVPDKPKQPSVPRFQFKFNPNSYSVISLQWNDSRIIFDWHNAQFIWKSLRCMRRLSRNIKSPLNYYF